MSGGCGTNWFNESISFADKADQDWRVSSFGLGNLGKP